MQNELLLAPRVKHTYKPSMIALRIVRWVVALLLACFFLLPFVIMLCRSVFTTTESLSAGAGLLPRNGYHFRSYLEAFDAEFLQYLGNTVIVVLCNIVGKPLTAAMAAYAFTKVKFRGRKLIFNVAMCTIMLPSILTMIPVYKIFVDIGWVDTLFPLTVPAFFGGGFLNIFLIMQFIRSLPKDMDEAAIIDGAGVVTLMFRITFPLVMPVIALVAVQSFFGAWNDFIGPLMYINNESLYTLSVGIYNKFFTNAIAADSMPNVQMATGVIVMIPPIIVFMLFQKQLIEGVTFSGIKA